MESAAIPEDEKMGPTREVSESERNGIQAGVSQQANLILSFYCTTDYTCNDLLNLLDQCVVTFDASSLG